MKISIFVGMTLISFVFFGCAKKVNITNINERIIQNQTNDIKTFLSNRSIYTYDQTKEKITTYFFKDKNGNLIYFDTVTYIPVDYAGELYDPFSQVVWTLKKLTNHKAKTIEKALEDNVKKNGYVRLFKDKNEYILDGNFARKLITSIEEFNKMIEMQENDNEEGVFFPYR